MMFRPLHDAVDSDSVEIVRILLASGADINLTTYSGKTVESLACSHDMRTFFRGLMWWIYRCFNVADNCSCFLDARSVRVWSGYRLFLHCFCYSANDNMLASRCMLILASL